MDEIKIIIKETFEKKLFDNLSKKKFKVLAQETGLKSDDLNFIIKLAFDFVNDSKQEDRDLFMMDWLRDIVNSVNDMKSDIQTVSEVQFSPVNDCSGGIINFIKSAKKSLYICVFTISDDRISEQVLSSFKDGIDVKIITDNEKQYDKGSDIQELVDFGVPVKVDDSPHHMHHKFAIIDNNSLLTGSYNWTLSASKYNQENYLITNDSFAVKKYLDEFYRLWKLSVPLK